MTGGRPRGVAALACWWGTRPSAAEDSAKGGALPGWLRASGVDGGGHGEGRGQGRRKNTGTPQVPPSLLPLAPPQR